MMGQSRSSAADRHYTSGVFGVVASAVASGLVEVWITFDARIVEDVNGDISRAPSLGDHLAFFLQGAVMGAVLSPPAVLVGAVVGAGVRLCFSEAHAGVRATFAVSLGAGLGASLSLLVWVLAGGWGPPALISCATGAGITAGLWAALPDRETAAPPYVPETEEDRAR